MTFAAEKNLLKTIAIETKNVKCSKTKMSTLKHTGQCSQANSSTPIHLLKQEYDLQFDYIITKNIQEMKDTPVDLNMTSPNEINVKMTHLAQKIVSTPVSETHQNIESYRHMYSTQTSFQKYALLSTNTHITFQSV